MVGFTANNGTYVWCAGRICPVITTYIKSAESDRQVARIPIDPDPASTVLDALGDIVPE